MEKHLTENTRRGFLGGLGAAFATLSFPTTLAAVHVLREEVDFWRGKGPDFSK